MAFNHGVIKISHVFQVLPSNSSEGFSLPLTYLDMLWFKWHPVERLFFYEFPDLSQSLFFNTIIPKLKTSLSITLSHFLHLAGIVTWPQDSAKPIIKYNPGDSVSLTVAESDDHGDDFFHLSGDHVKEAIALHPLVPKLSISDIQASAIALQVTLFPDKGLSIGINFLHTVLDGKSSTMFMKAWAYTFKNMQESRDVVSLTPQLTPVFDTKIVKDPEEIHEYMELMEKLTNRSPMSSMPMNDTEYYKGLVRATFKLSRNNISFLKNMLASWPEKAGRDTLLHLSTFVVTCAYISVCLLRTTTGSESYEKTVFGFAADYRSRLEPVVPSNYGGNLTNLGGVVSIEGEDLVHEDAVAIIAEKISNAIKQIKSTVEEGKLVSKIMNVEIDPKIRGISVAGSPKLEVYGTDFGWGKPKKVEVVSIGKDTIALAEDKDNDKGGLEVGLVMNSSEVEKFTSEFYMGLKHSST